MILGETRMMFGLRTSCILECVHCRIYTVDRNIIDVCSKLYRTSNKLTSFHSSELEILIRIELKPFKALGELGSCLD